MKNNAAVRFAFGLMALLLFAAASTSAAANLPNGAGGAQSAARSIRVSGNFDDADDSPCARFPKANVFDSFTKAFQSPEKVRCLNPNFEDDELNMKRLPPGLKNLVNLEVFSFGCLEKLETLPDEIGNLRKLEELIIDNGNGCSMSVAIPASIGKLEKLRVLRLYGAIEANGKAKKLPASIARLRKLEVLDLARNGLSIVPAQIAALPNLKILRLEYNSLRAVPAFIGNFKNLKELSLDSNGKLADLPVSLAKLKGLKVSMGNDSLKLAEQKRLRARFPQAVFSFEDESDDSAANETKPKAKPRTRRKH